jgi:hypothetical protein
MAMDGWNFIYLYIFAATHTQKKKALGSCRAFQWCENVGFAFND